MGHSIEAYCMIVALYAYVMIQSNMSVPPSVVLHGETHQISNISLGVMLLEESVRMRRVYKYIENPSLLTVITSFFFFGSYVSLDRDNLAWFYLREATTYAQLLEMHDEETYKTRDPIGCSRRRRLYWVLFVERFDVLCFVQTDILSFLTKNLEHTRSTSTAPQLYTRR